MTEPPAGADILKVEPSAPSRGGMVGLLSGGDTLLHNFLVTALGTVGNQLVTFAALPVLSRLYGPDEFGTWALFMSAAFAVPILAGMRYDIAIVVARTERSAFRLQQAIYVLGACLALLWIPVLYAISAVGSHYGAFSVPASYYLISVMIFANSAIQSGLMWWTRRHQFRRIAAVRTLLSVAVIATQLAFGAATQVGGMGLIIGTVFGQALTGLFVYILVEKEDRLFRSADWQFRHFRAVLVRYRRMPLYAAPYSLQGQGFMQAIVAILGNFGSAALAGQYAVSQRSVYYPMTVISSSLSQALLPRMSSARDELPRYQPFFLDMIRSFLLLLPPIYALLLFYGEPIAGFVLGGKWTSAGTLMAWLFLPSMLLVTGSWFERIFDILDRQRIQLILELCFNAATLVALALTIIFLSSPELGVLVTSFGLAIYYIVWLLTAFHVAHFSISGLAGPFAAGLAAFGVSAGILGTMRVLHAPPWVWLLVLPVAIIYYFVLARHAVRVLHTGFGAISAPGPQER